MLCIAPLEASLPHGPPRESSPSALYLEQRGTDWEAGGQAGSETDEGCKSIRGAIPFPECGTYMPHGTRVESSQRSSQSG